ncbi:MAG: TetR/AcrR family transcriptional regulator [Armatimonadota bacterium]|nr:TetR/AcrR family transcriptional regulator [Armatimonadota bacterium]MDW8156065.1 TetR/AcrR family transcriptional regulator [Armatimonadota bacterium]
MRSAATAGRVREARKEQTRARILEAARRAFAARGFHATLMDHVAQQAGLSKGALYVHFPSKEELFLALLDDAAATLVDRITQAIAGAHGGRAKVAAALESALDTFEEHEDLTWVFLVESSGARGPVEQRRWELRAALTDLVRRYLDEAVASGDLPPQDTALAAAVWMGAVSEVVVGWLRQPSRPLRDVVPQLTSLLLRSVGFPDA